MLKFFFPNYLTAQLLPFSFEPIRSGASRSPLFSLLFLENFLGRPEELQVASERVNGLIWGIFSVPVLGWVQ